MSDDETKITVRIDRDELDAFDNAWQEDARFRNRSQAVLWLIAMYVEIRNEDDGEEKSLGETLELTGELSD